MNTETIQEFIARGGRIQKIPSIYQMEVRRRLMLTLIRLGFSITESTVC